MSIEVKFEMREIAMTMTTAEPSKWRLTLDYVGTRAECDQIMSWLHPKGHKKLTKRAA